MNKGDWRTSSYRNLAVSTISNEPIAAYYKIRLDSYTPSGPVYTSVEWIQEDRKMQRQKSEKLKLVDFDFKGLFGKLHLVLHFADIFRLNIRTYMPTSKFGSTFE